MAERTLFLNCATYLDDLLVGHSRQEYMLFIFVGVEAHDIWDFAITEALDALASLRIPQLHLTVVTARQKLSAIIGESDIFYRLHMAMEGSKAITMGVDIPQLQRS